MATGQKAAMFAQAVQLTLDDGISIAPVQIQE